ncbi:hypothetical protein [Lentzea sp. NPDC059081]|uniref:hypothetical protein n=1 Tax=Lentzea sp. NPDC059081 TaxID=3346719 RepID=UPI0036884445
MLDPGVAVLVGFVVLVGNPWLNLDLTIALTDSDSSLRVATVLISYPTWQVDLDRAGSFLFWFWNLRTVLFVVLAVLGLARVRRWAGDKGGLFVTTVGMIALSAVAAGLVSGLVATTLLDDGGSLPYLVPGESDEFFVSQLGSSAAFGVVFGAIIGGVVAMPRSRPASRERRVSPPKSLW